MANIGSSNISFSILKSAYVAGGGTDASGNSNLRDNKTNTQISLSFFRNAGLTNGTSIPSSDEISINDDFKNKTFGSASSSDVTNKIEIKYHRYGSTFNDSWTAVTAGGSITIEDGTFLSYFWKASDNSLTKLGRIVNQTHFSSTSSYNTVTYDITQPEGTSGYLLLILYGWNYFRADMAIGRTRQLYNDNSLKTTLYQDSTSNTTSLNSNDWKTTSLGRKTPSVSSFNSTNINDLEDEIAQKSISHSFSQSLLTGTSSTRGWQQDKSGTSSGSTGPSRSSDGSSSKYYIYVETSSQSGTTTIATAALRVPITISSS